MPRVDRRGPTTSLACALLALMLLAGCAAQTAAPPSTSATATAKPAATEPAATEPAAQEKKTVALSWGSADLADPNADEFGKWFQDHFKVRITPVAIESADKLKMLAASDRLPDLIGSMGIGSALYNQLKSQQMIRGIPDGMLAKYPLLKKSIDENKVLQAFKDSTGRNTWLPLYGNVDSPQKAAIMAFYYRADWAQRLKIPAPEAMDEYYGMLKAFKEQDPDGDNTADTFGLTGWLWQMHFLPWTDTYAWIKEDGKWIPGFLSKNMLPALRFYNRLYQEMILDPNFATADAKQSFFTDKAGVIAANTEVHWVWKNIYVDFTGAHKGMTVEQSMKSVQFLPPLKADAGSRQQWAPVVECWGYAISARTTDEVLDRCLEIADWELTPEGRDFMTYGFVDQDWLIKDGKAVSILPLNPATGTQKRLSELYPSNAGLGLCMGYASAGTPWLNPPYPQECYDRADSWQELASHCLIRENIAITRLSTPLKDACPAAAIDAHEADFQKLIASGDVEADYNALMESYLKTQGLQAAIDEVNRVIAAQGLDH